MYGYLNFPNVSTSNSLQCNPSSDRHSHFSTCWPEDTFGYCLLDRFWSDISNVRGRSAQRCKESLIKPGFIKAAQPPCYSVADKQLETPLPSQNRRLSQSEPQLSPVHGMKNKHCLICHSIMPLRTKHCHECNKCVLTFDHHCPFMDNCIGEKNRALFFCYLIFEVCQLGLAVLLMRSNYAEWQAHYWLGLVFAVALMLAVLLTGLLIFHTYLMVKGITTWEYFSWQNITYLSKIPAYTNPFSLSIWENIKVYWLSSFKKQPHIWVPYWLKWWWMWTILLILFVSIANVRHLSSYYFISVWMAQK